MIITNDGRNVHVMNDAGSWTIENGWLVLSRTEARKFVELFSDVAPVVEQEPEDG